MNIQIDNRENSIMYVDKKNFHASKGDECIRLINHKTLSNIDAYFNIIKGYYNLNDAETSILKFVTIHNKYYKYSDAVKVIAEEIGKHAMTVIRNINSLRHKGLLLVEDNYMKLSSCIEVNKERLINAKFLIIELRPEITSGINEM